MRMFLSSRGQHRVARIGILLIAMGLVIVTTACDDTYRLTISSTAGGSVTTPAEGTSTYEAGTVVELVATPTAGYSFVNWTGDVDTIADPGSASTTVTMNADCAITANFETEGGGGANPIQP